MFTAYELSDNEPPTPRQAAIERAAVVAVLIGSAVMIVLTCTGVVR